MTNSWILQNNSELSYPPHTVHAGNALKIELTFRNMQNKVLSQKMGITEMKLSRHVTNSTKLTTKFALMLEKALKVPAEYWLTVQMNYELQAARNGSAKK